MRGLIAAMVTGACLLGAAPGALATQPAPIPMLQLLEPLSDAQVLSYATQPYDKTKVISPRLVLGLNHQTPVVAEFVCADVCPDYMVRIIHYALSDHQKCSDVGGVEKTMSVPFGIGTQQKAFCFPKVLADHWDELLR